MEQASGFPNISRLIEFGISMHRGIIKYDEDPLPDLQGHLVKEVRNLISIDKLLCYESLVLISAGNHPKDIQSGVFLRSNEDILILL